MSAQLLPVTLGTDEGATECKAPPAPTPATHRHPAIGPRPFPRATHRASGRTKRTMEPWRASTQAHRPLPDATATARGHPFEVVADERSAIESLYGRYANLLYRQALAILGSREDAEDLTQEVFATLCGPSAYDPSRGSMGAFLTAMTRSRAIDRLRFRGRSARLLKTWPEAVPCGDAPAAAWEGVAMRRTAERVRGALARLPAAQRQVVEMTYYRGLSQQEIAAELDTPLGTVKCWSRRALLELGRVLEEFGI